MRISLPVLLALVLLGCAEEPAPKTAAPRDPTTEPWYGEAVQELTSLNDQAREAIRRGRKDDASIIIQKGETISARLLAAQHPTLEATVGASDVDQLYGEMLLSNRNYGWARLFFQKNLSRWKLWRPQSGDTARRVKLAADEIAECDRRMEE